MLERDGIKAILEMSNVKQVSHEAYQLAYQHEEEDTYQRTISPTTAPTCSCLLSQGKKDEIGGHLEEFSIPSLEGSDFMWMLKLTG